MVNWTWYFLGKIHGYKTFNFLINFNFSINSGHLMISRKVKHAHILYTLRQHNKVLQ